MKALKLVIIALLLTNTAIAQTLTMDLGVGINKPSNNFASLYQAKPVNGLTVDAGLRYMFFKKLGAKVDVGFNRYASDDKSIDFKANFTRVNLQLYYNIWDHLYNFQIRLPKRLGLFVHAGAGMSFIKPLSQPFTNNNSSNFNYMGGFAIHYGITDRVAVFVDASNIYNLGQKTTYEGTLLTDTEKTQLFNVTFGVTISINSNCYYCNKPGMGL